MNSSNWGTTTPHLPWLIDRDLRGACARSRPPWHGGIRPSERGTFAALANPAVIDHCAVSGIPTAVELMPVHAFLQDRALQQRGQCWGYNTLGFFAPEPSYLSDGNGPEPDAAFVVRRLHAAGIVRTILYYVVYNHTAESDETGTLTLSCPSRGRTCQPLSARGGRPAADRHDSRSGNTLNLSLPRPADGQ